MLSAMCLVQFFGRKFKRNIFYCTISSVVWFSRNFGNFRNWLRQSPEIWIYFGYKAVDENIFSPESSLFCRLCAESNFSAENWRKISFIALKVVLVDVFTKLRESPVTTSAKSGSLFLAPAMPILWDYNKKCSVFLNPQPLSNNINLTIVSLLQIFGSKIQKYSKSQLCF